MKTLASHTKITGTEKHIRSQNNELKTDLPLSEKDEVKKAEDRTRKALKHHL